MELIYNNNTHANAPRMRRWRWVKATLTNLLCESRLFAVALLTELITQDSG